MRAGAYPVLLCAKKSHKVVRISVRGNFKSGENRAVGATLRKGQIVLKVALVVGKLVNNTGAEKHFADASPHWGIAPADVYEALDLAGDAPTEISHSAKRTQKP